MFEAKWISKSSNFEYIIKGPHNGDDYLIERRIKNQVFNGDFETIQIFITGNGTNHALIPDSKFFGKADIRIINEKEIYINNEHLIKIAWEN